MLKTLSSKAILTKARVMFGRRLKKDDYDQMLQMHSVAEVAGYLKSSTHYAQALAGTDENTVHRGQLENLLRRDRFEHYIRLIQYDFSRETGFYQYIIVRSEIDQLLTTIRLMGSGSAVNYIYSLPSYLNRYASFRLKDLAGVGSYGDLLTVLRKTPYYKVLEPYRPQGDDPVDAVACESALLTYYYRMLLRLVDDQFSGSNRKALLELFHLEIDAANIGLVYRLKRVFNIPPEQIRTLLLPFETPSRKTLEKMLESGNTEQLRAAIVNSRYERYLAEGQGHVTYVEGLTGRATYDTSFRDMRFSMEPPVVLVSYMVVLQIELENVTNIIEGIRYGVEPDEIEKLLII